MKTTLILKRASIMILFAAASIIIFTLFASQNSFAYADESYQSDGEIQASQECNDWKEAAEQDRINSTFADDGVSSPYEEIAGDFIDPNTFYIQQNRFNLVKRTLNGKDFSFKYNFRGFIGEPHGLYRSPNVQYFFNSDTKEMVFLTFGNGEEGFETYTYHGTGNTVFEDVIHYDKYEMSLEYVLANNVEKCYLDSKIQKIGQYNFQCFVKLNEVDIINQDYDKVTLEIGDCAFRKAGYNGNETTNTIVKMPFLKALNKDKVNVLLRNSKDEKNRLRWAECCAIEYDNAKYYPAKEDWEEDANSDRRFSTFAGYDGFSAPYYETPTYVNANCYIVGDGYNIIKRTINGKDFSFKYDIRGYIGEPHGTKRKANVQFFHNTQTKDTVFLTFGDGEKGFETFTYHGYGPTIFQDELDFTYGDDQKFYYTISEQAKTCYLDPKITKIGYHNFQRWENLELVDFVNKDYEHAAMKSDIDNIGDCAFYETNKKAGCEVAFLEAFSQDKIDMLLSEDERDRWAEECPVIFRGTKYKPA